MLRLGIPQKAMRPRSRRSSLIGRVRSASELTTQEGGAAEPAPKKKGVAGASRGRGAACGKKDEEAPPKRRPPAV